MRNKRILTLIFVVAFVTLLVGCLPAKNEAPIITSDPVKTGEVGVAYTYDVDATDPDGDTLTYTLDIKPTNMSISSTTGLINWIPATEGGFNVVVKVSDGDLDITQSFTIVVVEPWNPTPTKKYTITATAGPGGSISPSGAVTVNKGANKTFTITPYSPFYRLLEVSVDGGSVGAVSAYTFTNVTADHTIHADFILIGPVYNQNRDDHYYFIQDAINNSETLPGDTILVMAGTYPEDVTIGKADITLQAYNNPMPVIEGMVTIIADGVTVEGFTINGGNQGIRVLGKQDVKILNNVITGTSNWAINLYGHGNFGPVSNVTVSGNTIDNCYSGIMAYGGNFYVSDSTISDNTITNCTGVAPTNGAIAIFGTISGITISGNEISSNENLNGIRLGGGTLTDIAVKNNTISNNLGGVLIPNGTTFTNLVINFNNIEGNGIGVLNESGSLAYAEANWWGHESGPSGVGPGTGDTVSTNVDYIPWSMSPN